MSAIDTTAPRIATKAQSEAMYRDVLTMHRAETRRTRAVSGVFRVALLVSVGLNFLLGFGLASALPLVRVVPVFYHAMPSGDVETAVTTSQLPQTLNDAQIRAGLWQYVRMREEYSDASAEYDYNVVSAMSAGKVKKDYQDWINNKNKSFPSIAKTLGKTGEVHVEYSDSELDGDTYRVKFIRTVIQDDQVSNQCPYTASMKFSRLPAVPLVDRITYNPSALLVTEYPGSEALGNVGHIKGCS